MVVDDALENMKYNPTTFELWAPVSRIQGDVRGAPAINSFNEPSQRASSDP